MRAHLALVPRSLLRWTVALSALLGPALAHGQAAEVSLPSIPCETVRLANGLRVFLAPDPQARVASVRVQYAAGAGDDPDGRAGLAHVTEHLVGGATKHSPSGMGMLESAGGTNLNATTTLDATSYFETVPPERLDTALWLESDRMGFAASAVSETRLESAQATVRNERVQNRVDAIFGAFDEVTRGNLFPAWHPYAAGEWLENFDRIRVEDVRAFLATWYLPANATLSIAGRFDRDAAIAAVHRYFDPLSSNLPPVRPLLPASTSPNVRLLVRAPVVADMVIFEWTTASYGERDDAALDLVSSALDVRLNRALLVWSLATSVGSRQESLRARSVFRVVVVVPPGKDIGRAAEGVDDELKGMARRLSESELDGARRARRFRRLEALESPWGRATAMASTGSIGIEPGPGFDWGLSRYAGIDAAYARRVVEQWLVKAPRIVTTVRADRSAPIRGQLVQREVVTP